MGVVKAGMNVASGPPHVSLRAVTERDLEVFFGDQRDPDAIRMAAFPARSRDDHYAHWHRILADESVVARTIVFDGDVAGNVVAWVTEPGARAVGYWIGKRYWGAGIATAAVALFTDVVTTRPLHARVAKANPGSIRVLEKCGFVIEGEAQDGDVEELVMVLRDASAP